MTDIVIRTQNITKKYKNNFALNNVSINIRKGDIYGLIGKNGAGKTTLLRIISGLSILNEGKLEIFGQTSESDLNSVRSRTGCIIESPNFYPYLSARKNLEYYRIQKGIPGKECVEKALNNVGLSEIGNKKFKNYSLGMKQRLGLALAIMGNPDLLILDEPINGLDPIGIVEFREILKKLNRERNTTIIISSHILGELSQLATTYGFIDNGRLLQEITSKEIEEKCRHHLLVKVNDTAKASVVIEKELGCDDYHVLNDNQIKIYAFIDTPEIVTQALIKNNIMVSTINQCGANLEDYFVDLIGGNQNA